MNYSIILWFNINYYFSLGFPVNNKREFGARLLGVVYGQSFVTLMRSKEHTAPLLAIDGRNILEDIDSNEKSKDGILRIATNISELKKELLTKNDDIQSTIQNALEDVLENQEKLMDKVLEIEKYQNKPWYKKII